MLQRNRICQPNTEITTFIILQLILWYPPIKISEVQISKKCRIVFCYFWDKHKTLKLKLLEYLFHFGKRSVFSINVNVI